MNINTLQPGVLSPKKNDGAGFEASPKKFLLANTSSGDQVSFNGISNKNSNVSFGMALDPSKLKGFQKWGYALAQKVPKNFYNSGTLNYVAKLAKDYPGLFEGLTALGVTCTIRPLTILTMPGAKKEDKQYAAVKSIASGILGYIESLIIFKPLGDIVKKLGQGQYDKFLKKPFPFKYGTPQFNTFSFIVNYGSKFIAAIPFAILTFKLIPVMMEKLFPNRKKKPLDNYNPPIAAAKLSDEQQAVFDRFMQLSTKDGKGVA